MNTTSIDIYRGQFGQDILWTLFQSNGSTPFDATGYDISMKVWEEGNSDNFVSHTGTVQSAAGGSVGSVQYEIGSADFLTAGTFEAAWFATKAGENVPFAPFTIFVIDVP